MDVRVTAENPSTEQSTESSRRTGLPVKQLLILVTLLLAEPLTNATIRSFTDALALKSSGEGFVDNDVAGSRDLYSQLLESSLFLAKAATVYHWGRLSDKLGRRPILLLGSFGLGISTCILGSTNNPWLQTTVRSLQGVFGGNMETAKSVIAEITDGDNRYKAYAVLPLMQSTGISIGSSIGNLMAGFDERFPILHHIPFIKDHPLFIPCSIAAVFSFFAFYVTFYGFKETLSPEFHIDWKTLWNLKDQVKAAAGTAIQTGTSGLLQQTKVTHYGAVEQIQHTQEDMITSARQEAQDRVMKLLPVGKIQEGLRLKELIGPQLIIALLNYAFVSFLDQSQQTLMPLMYTSPIESYGLGLSPDDMAKIMTKWASYNVTAQLLLFPWLLKRYGPKRVYATCLSSMTIFFALFPAAHIITKFLGHVTHVVWGIISIQMAICSLLYMAYGCTQIFIMDAVPDKSCLGSVNGIGQSVGSSVRMIAAPLITFTFASSASFQDRWLTGYLTYLLLFSVTVAGTMISALLPGLKHSLAHPNNEPNDEAGELIRPQT